MKHFRDKDDIERFFKSSYINLEDVRDYFRERGNFVFSAKTDNFNSHVSSFILANTTLKELRKFIKKDVYISCTGFVLETNLDEEELLAVLKDAREDEHEEDESQKISQCYSEQQNDNIIGEFTYFKSRTSDVNLFDSHETPVDFKIRKIESNEINSYLVTCFPQYKKDIDLLKKLIAWNLHRDDEASVEVKDIGFSTLQDVESKHEAISNVLSRVDNYEIIGISGVEAVQIEDYQSEDMDSEVLSEEFQKIGGETKMISTNDLLEFLEDNSKTSTELTIAYYNADERRAPLLTIKDETNLVTKLRDIRFIQNLETISTKDDYEAEDRIISTLDESIREKILEEYFYEVAVEMYEQFI